MTYYTNANNRQPIPPVYAMGYSDDCAVTKNGPAQREFYIIHFVLQGKGVFNGNTVQKGQGFLITPNMQEHYYADAQNPWHYVWIISDSPYMEWYFAKFNADENGIFTFCNADIINTVADNIRQHGTAAGTQWLTQQFLYIFNNCTSDIKPAANAEKTYYDYSISFIRTNIRQVNVKMLCSVTGVSQPYLYKAFIHCGGCSPKQYIMHYRLKEAKRMLKSTDLPVKDIACAAGFDDALAFTRFFTKQTGLSPLKYRNSK